MEFTIPATLRDVRLSQWQRYIDVYDKNKVVLFNETKGASIAYFISNLDNIINELKKDGHYD
jgi:hypothetical protein